LLSRKASLFSLYSCALLLTPQDFPQFHHVSTGDLLRKHVRNQTPLGKEAKEYMAAGELVPDSLMIDLVMDDATPFIESGQSLLLDGFPRSLRQAQSLEKVAHIDLVINLDIPTQTIVDRIADRYVVWLPRGHIMQISHS
jgi:adenylate kinase family enzyme